MKSVISSLLVIITISSVITALGYMGYYLLWILYQPVKFIIASVHEGNLGAGLGLFFIIFYLVFLAYFYLSILFQRNDKKMNS